jgi:hypothetical protein
MSKLDEILDGKLTEVTPDLEVKGEKGIKTPDTDNPEQTKDGKEPAEAKQEVKEGPQYDKEGRLILSNEHMHNIAMNLHGTMAAVAKMQEKMNDLIKSHSAHLDQTKLHETALITSIKHHNDHEGAIQNINAILKSK